MVVYMSVYTWKYIWFKAHVNWALAPHAFILFSKWEELSQDHGACELLASGLFDQLCLVYHD